jgi:predicted ferric reductase
MHANVYAPFGRFTRPTAAAREIWIAGGVGISPFISWLDDRSTDCQHVTLFYFFTPGREFPSTAELSKRAQQRGVELQPISSGPASTNFTRRFAELVRDDPNQVRISFCGPKGLLAHVQKLMREHGIPESNISYEYFDFR